MKHLVGFILMLSLLSCGGRTARLQGSGDSVAFK